MTFGDWQSLRHFTWVEALRDCPQGPIQQAEGNVWIHTGMVLEELSRVARAFSDTSHNSWENTSARTTCRRMNTGCSRNSGCNAARAVSVC